MRGRGRTRIFCIVLGAVMVVVLAWTRLANLGTSFWSDEGYSAYRYANRGPHAIFFTKYVPNNHVLFNLLSWATTRAVGQFEAAYRFWSVVPGLAAVALAAWWMWKRVGPVAAVAILVLATASPVHLVLTPQGRGYGLAMLAGTAMLVTATRACERESARDVALFAASALVGIWTIPVFALAAATQALVLLANRAIRRAALVACAVVAAASLAWYAPMMTDLADNAHQRFGAQLPLNGFLMGPYNHLVEPAVGSATPLPIHSLLNSTGAFVVIAVLTIAALVRLARPANRWLLANLVVPIFGTYLALVIGRFYVQPRFASYLLLYALAVLAIGVQQGWDLLAAVKPARVVAAVVITVFALTGAQRAASVTKAQARLPWENVQFVGRLAKATGIGYIFTNTKHPYVYDYYLGPKRVVSLGTASIESGTYCRIPGPFIFVDDRYHDPPSPNVRCLRQRGAVRIQVPQQAHPPIRQPGPISVWVAPAQR